MRSVATKRSRIPAPSTNGHAAKPKTAKVFVGMPSYLYVDPRAVVGATTLASQVPGRTSFRLMSSSVAASNFNALWCAALNLREEHHWTHFAMLHQDVQPDPWWVDKLVDEMDKQGLDFLSVVLTLKDEKGITSTGVLDRKSLCMRRLTMKEICQLPQTFTSADLGKLGYKNHVLLPASGIWICRFDQPWVEKVWFEAPSRILHDQSGLFFSASWDEGWNFALLAQTLGVKIGCTRLVPAVHHGGGAWGNQDPWGTWETDGGESDYSWILGTTT